MVASDEGVKKIEKDEDVLECINAHNRFRLMKIFTISKGSVEGEISENVEESYECMGNGVQPEVDMHDDDCNWDDEILEWATQTENELNDELEHEYATVDANVVVDVDADVVDVDADVVEDVNVGVDEDVNVDVNEDVNGDVDEDVNTHVDEDVNGGMGQYSDIESIYSPSDELESLCKSSSEEDGSDSEVDMVPRRHKFRNNVIELGNKFFSPEAFKMALRGDAIKRKYDIRFVKNEGNRVTATCSKNCGWRIHASFYSEDGSFQIKTFNSKHTCSYNKLNSQASASYLAAKYMDTIRDEPTWKPSAIKKAVLRDLDVNVSKYKVYRARKKARLHIDGDHGLQFSRARDYCQLIQTTNPGSIAVTTVDRPTLDDPARFKGLFICFKAMKIGFLEGCRPFIGLDGCFLKGPYKGQLLSAISKDGDNGIFPIAIGVVRSETKQSWEWFLNQLESVLGPLNRFTFMSDRQKGLVEIFEDKLTDFVPARLWSRSRFNDNSRCDLLVNNLCETWNDSIGDARDKPLITMLEWIRGYLMYRFQSKREWIQTQKRLLCLTIADKLTKLMDDSRHSAIKKACDDIYEVCYKGVSDAVNLANRTCSCREWDVRGIPCMHAIACIIDQRGNPEDFVDSCYHRETYLRTYTPVIFLMPLRQMIREVATDPIHPPIVKPSSGRPKKARKKAVGEVNNKSGAVSRKKQLLNCRKCGAKGHNVRTCKATEVTPQVAKKRYTR
ncbi:uncharacterized protein LOC132316509 [Cornus florida]|uniref:uncharacterized protein LOC132316509 n=1 Tax=Cornus florida TaxID=4283 RepID=UPI00289A0335|nr:uncharacterized protein LOC132316509 [Cornus florida]